MTAALEVNDNSFDKPTLAQKVAFLTRAESYSHEPLNVGVIETHMSWVFLAGDLAYKLKKPLRLPYLDFSTLEKREIACRAEIVLNRRLAPHLYRGVIPLRMTSKGLVLGEDGQIVDWLVVMRRVDERLMLDAALSAHTLDIGRIRALETVLGHFYRGAHPVFTTPVKYLAKWRRVIRQNRTVLLEPKLSLPIASVLFVDRVQRDFLAQLGHLLVRRLQRQKIVDCHGDLRPEHVWLGKPLAIIDCLEFNSEFRAIDPFDELSYLAVECERFGAPQIGNEILRRLSQMLSDGVSPELLVFYRCYRATLRANLSIAHLLEPNPRTPGKWRPLALCYLGIAKREALLLNRILKRRVNRPGACPDAGAELPVRKARQRPARRSYSG